MRESERFRLRFGGYMTPAFRYGQHVRDAVRGRVKIVGITDARIPWPICLAGSHRVPVVYKGLLRALRRESNQAIRHWFGVTPWLLWKWKRALGIPRETDGTKAIRSLQFKGPDGRKARAVGVTKARALGRRERIAASRRGKRRPRHVIEAMKRGRLAKPVSEETRRRMSEAHKRRGTRPPWLNLAWSKREDALLRKLSPAEVVSQTGRTIAAVRARRAQLGLTRLRAKFAPS